MLDLYYMFANPPAIIAVPLYMLLDCDMTLVDGRSYKPLILVRGSGSHQSKTQIEDQKDEDTRKKGI